MGTTANELKSKLDGQREAARREAYEGRYVALVERLAREGTPGGDHPDAAFVEGTLTAVGLTWNDLAADLEHVAERSRLAGIVERGDVDRVHSAVGLAKQLRDGLIRERAALDVRIADAEQRVSDAERAAAPVRRAAGKLIGMEHLPSRCKVCPPQPQPVTPKAEPSHWRGLAAFFGRATPTIPDERAALLRDAWHAVKEVMHAVGRPIEVPDLEERPTKFGFETTDRSGWSRLDLHQRIIRVLELDAGADEAAIVGAVTAKLTALQAEVRAIPRKTMDLSGVAHRVRA